MTWRFIVERRASGARWLFVRKDTASGVDCVHTIEGAPLGTGFDDVALLAEQAPGGEVTAFLQGALDTAWSMGLRPSDP